MIKFWDEHKDQQDKYAVIAVHNPHKMARTFKALDEQLERIERIAQVLNRALSEEEGFDPHLVDLFVANLSRIETLHANACTAPCG